MRLTLSLLMLWRFTNNKKTPVALDQFAVVANPFY